MKSILNIDKFITTKNENDLKDIELLINKDDLIKKFLKFLENWEKNETQKISVLFIIKILQYVIKGCGTESFDKQITEE